ncbi:MAG TPA: hypothetical protein DIC42_04155 [Holosporales bacterium]|nr:hypothetical protein [Holosporales bacterium]
MLQIRLCILFYMAGTMVNSMKKIIACFFVVSIAGVFFAPGRRTEYVNVYNWYRMLPRPIIDQFEKETGINVRYDVFDNNEVLEAKLLATNSGYDVVFPSASPYVAHQLEAGIYTPLNKDMIPNIKYVDPFFLEQMKKVDPSLQYAIPYVWGTTGLLYDEDAVAHLFNKDVLNSSGLIFDLENVSKVSHLGVALLEESVDVFPMVMWFLGLDPSCKSSDGLNKARALLLQIRPHIKRFSGDRMSSDLLSGDLVLAQFWSGDAYGTILAGKKMGKNFRYTIPKEGTTLWIDVMAIPVGAPNMKNAYKFVNFMLRPDIAAQLSNATYATTTVTESRSHINKELLQVKFLYPDANVMSSLQLDTPSLGESGREYDKERLRIWAKVKQARF